jgi:hypothetical protein
VKKSLFTNSFLIGLTFILFSFDTPTAWFNAGSKPKSYEMGIEKGAGLNGKNSAILLRLFSFVSNKYLTIDPSLSYI